jgi:hypothetical protein
MAVRESRPARDRFADPVPFEDLLKSQ